MKKGRFCARFKEAIQRLKMKFNSFLENNIDDALRITTVIKNIIENPIADVLVKLSKTDVDDKILEKSRMALRIAVDKLAIINECNQHEDLNDKLKCWIENIKLLPKDVQNAMLAKFAAIYAAQMDDNKYSQNVYDAAVQTVYSVQKENK